MSMLKLHSATRSETTTPQVIESRAVANLCRAFAESTGWEFEFNTSAGDNVGLQRSASKTALPRKAAAALAQAMLAVVNELSDTKTALWQREAELAAGVPVSVAPPVEPHLAERLESLLASGAKAIGCRAAAVYLLDDATSELKLRSCWGLPSAALLAPPRPLHDATADLEALLGHAVVLEDAVLNPAFDAPEDCGSAVCVPISTATNPLGTLWLFGDLPREFSDSDTNMAEMLAGRMASELEREVLRSEAAQVKQARSEWSAAAQKQQQRLPKAGLLAEAWQIGGCTQQAEGIGGDFYDWNMRTDGRLALTLGDAHGRTLNAGFTSVAAHAALRSHDNDHYAPHTLLARVNQTLCAISLGDELASVMYGLLNTDSGDCEFALAGSVGLWIVSGGDVRLLTTEAVPLGALPDAEFQSLRCRLNRGDAVVAMSAGALQGLQRRGSTHTKRVLLELVNGSTGKTSAQLTQHLRAILADGKCAKPVDQTVLFARRRR